MCRKRGGRQEYIDFDGGASAEGAAVDRRLEAERGEEPLVLAGRVFLFKDGLDLFLCVFTLRGFLEGILADGALEALEFECVSCGHQVVVRDDLDKRLYLAALGNLLGSHALVDLLRVSLNTGGKNVRESLVLGAIVKLLNNDNLYW